MLTKSYALREETPPRSPLRKTPHLWREAPPPPNQGCPSKDPTFCRAAPHLTGDEGRKAGGLPAPSLRGPGSLVIQVSGILTSSFGLSLCMFSVICNGQPEWLQPVTCERSLGKHGQSACFSRWCQACRYVEGHAGETSCTFLEIPASEKS